MPIRTIYISPLEAYQFAGRLVKGKPNDSESELEDLTYFRFDPVKEIPGLGEAFHQTYGSEPDRLLIHLAGDTPESTLTYWMESYTESNQLDIRCDGEMIVKKLDPKTGRYDRGGKCFTGFCSCSRVARLHILLPEMERVTGRLLRFMLVTKSLIDIKHLLTVLKMVESRYLKNGYLLSEIPFYLSRQPETIKVADSNGVLVEQLNYSIRLDVAEEFVRGQEVAAPQSVDSVEPFSTDGTYLPYLENLFQRYFPQHNLLYFIREGLGLETYEELVQTYPILSEVLTAIRQWTARALIPVYLHEMVVKLNRRRNPDPDRFKYIFDVGFSQIIMYTRQPWRDGGFLESDDQWQEEQTVKFDPSYVALLEEVGKELKIKTISL